MRVLERKITYYVNIVSRFLEGSTPDANITCYLRWSRISRIRWRTRFFSPKEHVQDRVHWTEFNSVFVEPIIVHLIYWREDVMSPQIVILTKDGNDL